MDKENKIKFILSTALGGIIVIGVLVFFIYLYKTTTKETEIVISDSSIVIEGMYGDTYSLNDITSVELKDNIPEIIQKTNGAGLGESKKGYFDIQGLGECKLFILSEEGPYVYILTGEKYIIINYKDKSKTEQLFNDLSAKVKK